MGVILQKNGTLERYLVLFEPEILEKMSNFGASTTFPQHTKFLSKINPHHAQDILPHFLILKLYLILTYHNT